MQQGRIYTLKSGSTIYIFRFKEIYDNDKVQTFCDINTDKRVFDPNPCFLYVISHRMMKYFGMLKDLIG